MTEKKRVVVIGSGTGGTIVAHKLKKFRKQIDVTIIDKSFTHLYHPGNLFLIVGESKASKMRWEGKKFLPKFVNTLKDEVTSIDLENQVVETKEGSKIDYDYLILASGIQLAMEKAPWWNMDEITHFCRNESANATYEKLRNLEKGTIVVNVPDFPHSCPIAPLEAALLFKDWANRNQKDGIDVVFTTKIPLVFPKPPIADFMAKEFEKKDIEYKTNFIIKDIDYENKVISTVDNQSLSYDMLVAVPPQRSVDFVIESGIPVDEGGWVKINQKTMQVEGYPNVFAMGDTSNSTAGKAGSTAHSQAPAVAKNIKALIEGEELNLDYDGENQCFIITEMGKASYGKMNFEHTGVPSRPGRFYWWGKLFFKTLYTRFILRGYM